MSISEWGTATWYLFHTLAYKLKPEHEKHAPILLQQFISICTHIPCPTCREHANNTLKHVKIKSINSKNNLIKFLWEFHNKVNSRLKRNKISLNECNNIYKNAVTKRIILYFIQILSLKANNEKAMLDTFQRQRCINNFNKYIIENISKYNN